MFYILTKPGEEPVYPYTMTDLKRANPDTSFPRDMTGFDASEFNCHPVQDTAPPSHDPITENLTEQTPVQIDGVWTQVWLVSAATPEEIEQRREDALATIRSQRAEAYREESDPLFFKAERGEGTKADWEAKVEEIRSRYPYPEGE
jgi:hypothetical protein